MNERSRGAAEMTAAMLISGTIGWFVVKSGLPVQQVVFWRCLIGAFTLLFVCLILGLFKNRLVARQIVYAVLGGIAIVINWLLLFAAYPLASISTATVIYNTQPFMLVILGALFLGEKLTASKLFWLAIAFAGVFLMAHKAPGTVSYGAQTALGAALALGAAFFYALAAIFAKKLKGTPPHLIALIQVTVGTVLLSPFVWLSPLPHEPQVWTLLATLGMVHTGLMYILLYAAIQRLPTHITGSLSFIYPIVAVAVDAAAFGHRLELIQILGAAAILIAAAAANLGWTFPGNKKSAIE